MRFGKVDLSAYPALETLTKAQLAVWPEHEGYLIKSYEGRSERALVLSNEASEVVITLAKLEADGLRQLPLDYRHVCEDMILDSEIHFRRTGEYPLSNFEEAARIVYSDAALMHRYMNGLLLSNVFWMNHANALECYVDDFLPNTLLNGRHLEVGPGHGLLLYFAAKSGRSVTITGWDISSSSLDSTRRCLEQLGVGLQVDLVCTDVLATAGTNARFDSIVLGEVLEHLEDPIRVLKNLRDCLDPGGLIWVNMPVNSPAPDHIYLIREPEGVVRLVEESGFVVEKYRFFPMTGYSEERARKTKATINVGVIARRPSNGRVQNDVIRK